MISICIPIYNYYAYPLVRRLTTQIEQMGDTEAFEILCIDNCSTGYNLNQNTGICDIATYLRLNEKIDRWRLMSLFLKYTKGEWLLFLDADSKVPDNYLKTYKHYVGGKADVLVGGATFDARDNDKQHRLRYRYGTKVEHRPVEERKKHPYQAFSAGNFMIRRTVFEGLKPDPQLSRYGHVDLMMGYRLQTNRTPLLHIDNAVVVGDVASNAEYLNKSVEETGNLVEIYNQMWEDQRFCRSVILINRYACLRRMGLSGIYYGLFRLMKTPMESQFVGGTVVSLRLFSCYKLGVFIQRKQHPEKKSTMYQ